jgi:D-3-phosphoglycerate dehydrogenase
MVNAGAIAKDKGIVVDETFRETAEDGESRIKIFVDAEDMTRHAAGTVLSDGVPRIVEIRDIKIDAAFAPHMIYVRNDDKPGFIGAFGSMLGQAGVNIATFNLGRDKPGGDAICYVAVDTRVDDDLLARIEAIPQVKRARRLAF